ncbi:hypothetical protein O6H91_02G088300 [Diphasiastrum complanatum]|uniref:Uncharacterized protein n=1 Tax=Diphasiastrum complanatum TaxID=34168 RepID=A0ACC2EI73_DIPCM|nr:hypothetical protein O6H91_02G088300 [Diphasiastrum complanatum]
MSWWESLLPMGIIGGMLMVMGNIQYGVDKAMHGKPKHPGADMWDRLMEERDNRLLEEVAIASRGKQQ